MLRLRTQQSYYSRTWVSLLVLTHALGGTTNHLLLVDLRPQKLDGARAEQALERANIFLNKNSVPGDTRPFVPAGIRIGAHSL